LDLSVYAQHTHEHRVVQHDLKIMVGDHDSVCHAVYYGLESALFQVKVIEVSDVLLLELQTIPFKLYLVNGPVYRDEQLIYPEWLGNKVICPLLLLCRTITLCLLDLCLSTIELNQCTLCSKRFSCKGWMICTVSVYPEAGIVPGGSITNLRDHTSRGVWINILPHHLAFRCYLKELAPGP